MRKKIISERSNQAGTAEISNWLNLESIARVELTSEDPAHPIEAALQPNNHQGWRAIEAGSQTIRLLFDEPTLIHHIQLVFRENNIPRTQEFLLRWRSNTDTDYKEIVRQQYNFSPPESTEELEEYTVELENMIEFELTITPDISGRSVQASLTQLCLG